ncbi:MAG: hypothetical protein Kow0031_10990 [Anaerolineae bacterium]
MKAILESLKAAARRAANRLKALWARARAQTTVTVTRVKLTARNIWRNHKEPILWSLAWIAFGTLATLGIAGVYYTSPEARRWLEDTTLAIGKLVSAPFGWLKVQQPATAAVAQTATATITPPTAPPAAPSAPRPRVTYQIPIPPGQEKPAPAA